MDAASDKSELRATMRDQIIALDEPALASASSRLCTVLEQLFAYDTLMVLSFEPISRANGQGGFDLHEADLRAFNDTLIRRGRLALPRIDWENRTMRATRPNADPKASRAEWLEVRRHGVPEPRGGEPVSPESLGAILVPGLAFDRAGGRLGRGAGFYDRYLQRIGQSVRLIGVCFEAQVIERVPMEAHDRRVGALVTDAGVTECV